MLRVSILVFGFCLAVAAAESADIRGSVVPPRGGFPTAARASSSFEHVPDGKFAPPEKPRRAVKLPAFWMDRTEVTNAPFCDFLNAFRNNREEQGVRWITLDDPPCRIGTGEKRGECVVEKDSRIIPSCASVKMPAGRYAAARMTARHPLPVARCGEALTQRPAATKSGSAARGTRNELRRSGQTAQFSL